MTHQDCLQSWLEVKGGNDKCDLCLTKFRFAPKYAQDAPERLSRMEVLTGLMMRATSKWVPFGIRILLVAGVWLGILPLMTAYLYQGWMHRPSSIKTRFRWDLVPRDLVNGGILTVIIVISFLSIMSLLDFFRVKWVREMARNNEDRNRGDTETDDTVSIAPVQIGEDEDCLEHFDSQQSLREKMNKETLIVENMIKQYNKRDHVRHDDSSLRNSNSTSEDESVVRHSHEESDEYSSEDEDDDEDSLVQRMMRLQEMGEEPDHVENAQDEMVNLFFPNIQIDDGRLNPQPEPVNRQLDEDNAMVRLRYGFRVISCIQYNLLQTYSILLQQDADIQIPIQQLIGLRGPIVDVFRNLAWLLAFQTTFIGLFVCVPRYVGTVAFHQLIFRSKTISAVAHLLLKYMIFVGFDIRSKDESPMDLNKVAQIMNEANETENSLFQPKDIGHILFGYIFISSVTFLFQGLLSIYRKFDTMSSRIDAEDELDFARDGFAHRDVDGMRIGNRGGAVPNHNIGRDHRNRIENQEVGPEEMKAFIADIFGTVIEITAAASKISFLVCFKMFILPFLLGTWLDLSTLKLFDSHVEDRLFDAGSDIVGFFLLHWVVGITFMLTVTVSVLQLREVFHPDILAPVIRPQEPQPDLLINLLEDSWWTHTKRMVPSLAIYAMILAVHVWLPCKLIHVTNMQEYIPLFRPHFWYPFYAHLQRPLELMIFHLSVLSILEKNKNCLGELQHAFLSKLLKILGLLESFLPRNIEAWEYVGDKSLYTILSNDTPKVDHFWEELINFHKRGINTDTFIESNLKRSDSVKSSRFSQKFGVQKKYICLSPGIPDQEKWILLPVRLGRFCFQKKICSDGRIMIEIWKERVGDAIPRPPKGWDYLADGGAVEQGRWAWGQKEKMSDIELRVAARTPVVPISEPRSRSKILICSHFLIVGIPRMLKLCIAAIISWIAVTAFTSGIIFLPSIVGRFMLQILEVPHSYVHDPFVLVLGSICIAPVIKYLFRRFCSKYSENTMNPDRKRHFPPLRKMWVLGQVLSMWFLFCPLLVGCLYHQLFGTLTPQVFKEFSFSELMKCLPVGILLTHIWAAACFVGAFKYQFWVKIRQIAIDGIAGAAPPDRNNNRRQDQDQRQAFDNLNINDDDVLTATGNPTPAAKSASWQGINGNIGIFARTLFAILVHQEWDKIDRALLMDDFLSPLFHFLLALFAVPVACLILAETLLHFDSSLGTYLGGLLPTHSYQSFMLCSLSLQIALKFKDILDLWYEAAHKTARDHRYLIGEVLQNYESES